MMENASPGTGAERAQCDVNLHLGTLPPRLNTVLASVLAAMLESKTLTGMDSVVTQSTTRLSGAIHVLFRQYGWPIEREEVAVGTKDGRVAWVTAYWLPAETIANALEMGLGSWIDEVKAAAADRRRQANKADALALQRNHNRQRKINGTRPDHSQGEA